ncbi:unnamed protein product [Amoebophrya sp. A120]|nr:unnamed protein product [Amoebophrya sp. A120]|eukprot:GSA120T00012705001.1
MGAVRFAARRRLSKRDFYWPPPKHTGVIPLGTDGKQAFVFHGKSEESGLLEPQVAVTLKPSLASKLFSLTAEELGEVEKLAPRISSYFELYAAQVAEHDRRVQRDQMRSDLFTLSMGHS